MSRASESWASGNRLEWTHEDIRAAVIFRHGKAGERSKPRFSILRGGAYHRPRIELIPDEALSLAHWILATFGEPTP